ncbi:MAG: endonuclease/exonuclease/phosphatase family protein [Bdellovibrionota bacterium]
MKLGILLMLFSVPVFATDIPPDNKVIQQLTNGGARSDFPTEVRLLNWNIEKGERGDVWNKDIAAFAADRNLVHLQEGYQTPSILGSLNALNGLSFFMANAFVYKGTLTGVIGGFATQPASLEFRRSPQVEPVLNSPKMTLISTFQTIDGHPLKVVNVHGINFVGPDKLKNQLDDVAAALAGYGGNLILSGDFNTWNDARLQVLMDAAKKMGLTEVPFTRAGGNSVLDHVFQRGCVVEKSWVVENVASSDHDPEFANLNCAQNY